MKTGKHRCSSLATVNAYSANYDSEEKNQKSMDRSLLTSLFGYSLVGILWGTTNPFIKHAQGVLLKKSKAVEETQTLSSSSSSSPTSSISIVQSIRIMLTEPTVYIPFIVNQTGSLLFYVILLREPISIAAPVCNSLTFIITALTGNLIFHEEIPSPYLVILGVMLVLAGVYICMTSEHRWYSWSSVSSMNVIDNRQG